MPSAPRCSTRQRRMCDLAAADRQRRAAHALLLRFADAEDRKQSRPPCGQSLSSDEGVGLAVILSPPRMYDDDGARSGVFEHLRAEVAGMRAGRFGMAVLPANGDSSSRCPSRGGKQGSRGTNQNVQMRRNPRRHRGDRTRSRAAQPSIHASSNFRQSTGAYLSPRKGLATESAPRRPSMFHRGLHRQRRLLRPVGASHRPIRLFNDLEEGLHDVDRHGEDDG